jgi:hypothetical protein
MHQEHVRERLAFIAQCIDDAALACRETGYAPEELKSWVRELDRRAETLDAVAPEQLHGWLEVLEEIGARAAEACREARHLAPPQLRSAVHAAHQEIAELKRQLH